MSRRALGILSIVPFALIVIYGILYARLSHPRMKASAPITPVYARLSNGDIAPQFVLPTTHGVFDLGAQDKPVFVEVFATWCQGCQREVNVVNAVYRSFGWRVSFVAIPGSDTGSDGTSPETPEDVLNFQNTYRVQYPIAAYDPQLTAAQQYVADRLPTFVVIDRQKKITYINSGEVSQRALTTALKSVLR
jgi:thiol-disulfide isomerase/thioredoxin